MNRGDRHHEAVAAWLEGLDEDLVTTPLALAEMDHLVSRAGGPAAAGALHESLSLGAYLVEWWPEAVRETVSVAKRFSSSKLGLTDASLVALAGRLPTTRVGTLDERHFRALPPLTGEPAFTLLPADRD